MKFRTELNGTSVLVVGGAGFIGSNLCQHLLRSDIELLTVVDNFLSSERQMVPRDRRIELIEGSITDNEILDGLPESIDYVWHLACYHGNQSSIANPVADHDNNLMTSLKLFQYLSKRKLPKKVVYAAAGCAVAAKTYDEPIETHEDAPVSLFHDSPYSISKLVGEMYGNYFFKRHRLPFVKARFQNVYGPGEILGAGKWRGTSATVWRNVTPTFVWKALNKLPLPLENGGDTSRDFIYIDDICDGLVRCAIDGQPGEAYNLASGKETAIREWASMINELTSNQNNTVILPRRDWDQSGRRFASTQKSQTELGFVALTEPAVGLMKTVDWTRANIEMINGAISRHSHLMG